MPYEIFTRKVVRRGSPAVTITKMGRIAVNKNATEAFEKNAVEYILLMWDSTARKIGIRPITKKDSRAYPLKYGIKGNGAAFSCKTFLDFIGIDYSTSTSLPATWAEDFSLLETTVPSDLMKTPRQQKLVDMDARKAVG